VCRSCSSPGLSPSFFDSARYNRLGPLRLSVTSSARCPLLSDYDCRSLLAFSFFFLAQEASAGALSTPGPRFPPLARFAPLIRSVCIPPEIPGTDDVLFFSYDVGILWPPEIHCGCLVLPGTLFGRFSSILPPL